MLIIMNVGICWIIYLLFSIDFGQLTTGEGQFELFEEFVHQ